MDHPKRRRLPHDVPQWVAEGEFRFHLHQLHAAVAEPTLPGWSGRGCFFGCCPLSHAFEVALPAHAADAGPFARAHRVSSGARHESESPALETISLTLS